MICHVIYAVIKMAASSSSAGKLIYVLPWSNKLLHGFTLLILVCGIVCFEDIFLKLKLGSKLSYTWFDQATVYM